MRAMILTCPSCDTKYVVKDGAIPPQGRQVRCANCKESWHQMPEGEAAVSPPPVTLDEAPEPIAETAPPVTVAEDQPPAAERPETVPYQDYTTDVMASEEFGITGEPVPDPAQPEPVSDEPAEDVAYHEVSNPPVPHDDYALAPTVEDAISEPVVAEETSGMAGADDAVRDVAEEDFAVHIPEEDETPRGRTRIVVVVALLLAIVAAAAWFFAPPAWKSRLGIAGVGKSPLELMVTTSDRQQLASGNELLAISGRVINPTGEEQAVPPIRAELRNKTSKKVVYQWTIAPPARSLPPGGSASFNSAEVDIPPGGDELTVTLASAG